MADTSVIFNILAKDGATGVLGKVGSALQSIGDRAAGFVTGAIAMNGLSSAFDFAKNAVFGFNAILENSQIAFTTMLGSGQKAQDFLNQLQAFAKATPFEFEGLVKNAQNMMGMGIAAKDVIPDLRALGDSVASVGGSASQVDQVTLAFDQMAAKGTLDMGNMNQLLQGGVPNALRILADQYHVTTGQMIQMISTGKVQSSEALPKLIDGLEHGTKSVKALGGMMDKQSQTFTGALSNISDGLQQALAGAFKPFFNVASSGAQALGNFFSSDKFSAWAGKVSNAMGKVLDVVKYTIGWITGKGSDALDGWSVGAEKKVDKFATAVNTGYHKVMDVFNNVKNFVVSDLIPVVRDLFEVFGPTLAGGVGLALAAFRALSGTLQPIGGILKDVFGFMDKHKTTFQGVAIGVLSIVGAMKAWKVATEAWTAVTKIATGIQAAFNIVMDANPIVLVLLAIIGLVAGFAYLWTHSAAFRDFWIHLWNDIWGFLKAVGHWFAHDFAGFFVDTWNHILGFFKSVGAWFAGPFKDFFVDAAKAVAAPFVWLYENVFKPVFSVITRIVVSFFNLFKYAAEQVIRPVVQNVIKPALEAVGNAALWVWHNVFEPFGAAVRAIIGAIGAAAVWVWQNVFVPVGHGIEAAVSAVGNAFVWLWHNAIEPAVNGIADAAKWVWNRVIDPVFHTIEDAVKKIGGVFKDVFTSIGGFVKDAFRDAVGLIKNDINAIIGVIDGAIFFINTFVIDRANQIPGVNFPHIPKIPQLASGGTITSAGLAVVGERGAEVVSLPTGSTVHPHGTGPGGSGRMQLTGNVDGAFATVFKQLVRTGQIAFYDSSGQLVTVA